MPKGVPNKKYTPEFKKLVVETMLKEKLSYTETAERFEIRHKRVQDWERIYLTEGPDGFAAERRGGSRLRWPKELPKEVEEDLLAEVQRLRAENAYLKNLQALVLEDERHPRQAEKSPASGTLPKDGGGRGSGESARRDLPPGAFSGARFPLFSSH